MRKIEVKLNFSNKTIFTLLVIILILAFGIVVYAYGTNNPPVFGHSAAEIGEGTIANTLTITGGKVGVGTSSPAATLNVNGNLLASDSISSLKEIVTRGYTQTTRGLPYQQIDIILTPKIVELSPNDVGVVYAYGVGSLSSECMDKNGCQITIGMINWDGQGRTASRQGRLFISSTQTWRIDSPTGDIVSGTNNNNVDEQWCAWDCCFSDADLTTNTLNGKSDPPNSAFGFLNVKGGSYSDTTTSCILIIED